MVAQACQLQDLGPDILGQILASPLLDQRSRAFWEASWLPEVWRVLDLTLDLADEVKTSSAVSFLGRRGLWRVNLTTKCSAAGTALPRQRLGCLLGKLTTLRGLHLQSHDIAAVCLSDLQASLPELDWLTLAEEPSLQCSQRAANRPASLPQDHLTGLQGFSQLEELELRFSLGRLPDESVGQLLRGLEALTELTRLFLTDVGAEKARVPFRTKEAWSPQLSRLESLQEFGEGVGLKLPPELALLPELFGLTLRCFSWRQQGGVLCALPGLYCLEVQSALGEEGLPEPTGLLQALSTLGELRWDGWPYGLQGTGKLCLDCLTSLELFQDSSLFESLLWSSKCQLQHLFLNYDDRGNVVDLSGLSPLTTLTALTVMDCPLVILPGAPCLAHLQGLTLWRTGLTRIPAELRHAESLQLLELETQPDLVIGRGCADILAGLESLKQVKLEDCPNWDLECHEWAEHSVETVRRLCHAEI